ncbi:MAG: arginase family protein [Candidatus Bathyarchaeota archaeon]|nr:arginase family protein [Candidatus Bathyarchaeota archaeon]
MKRSALKFGIVSVPYNVGSKGLSIEKGSEALRKAGIIAALRHLSEVEDFGDLKASLPAPDCSDPKLLNSNQVETLCRAMADKLKEVVAAGCLPLVIGGDCSLAMGVVEGLRSSTRQIGMVYMDAHGDFNTPETTPSGIIGGMDVAIVAGRGPKRLAAMFGYSPLVPEENIVLYGVRDLDRLEAEALAASKVRVYSRSQIRAQGAENVAGEALRYLESKCDGVYLHVDLDVLDVSVFSAQGLSVPDGLSKEEFQRTVRVFVASGKLCGLAFMVFDAAKDADGSQAEKIVGLITGVLKQSVQEQ